MRDTNNIKRSIEMKLRTCTTGAHILWNPWISSKWLMAASRGGRERLQIPRIIYDSVLVELERTFLLKIRGVRKHFLMWRTAARSARTSPICLLAVQLWKVILQVEMENPSQREIKPRRIDELLCHSSSLSHTIVLKVTIWCWSCTRNVQRRFFKRSSAHLLE